jgi:hypothetical protein
MIGYRVTKYNPRFRDRWGAYPDDEWTCPSQIGDVVGGLELTLDVYMAAEQAYVDVALAFWGAAGHPPLTVRGLEDYREPPYPFPEQLAHIAREAEVFEGCEVSDRQMVARLVRLNLRTLVWCRLEAASGFYIHFSYDYYMYIGGVQVNDRINHRADRSNLFIEQHPSPLEGVQGDEGHP